MWLSLYLRLPFLWWFEIEAEGKSTIFAASNPISRRTLFGFVPKLMTLEMVSLWLPPDPKVMDP